jgi:hypothetical protein
VWRAYGQPVALFCCEAVGPARLNENHVPTVACQYLEVANCRTEHALFLGMLTIHLPQGEIPGNESSGIDVPRPERNLSELYRMYRVTYSCIMIAGPG